MQSGPGHGVLYRQGSLRAGGPPRRAYATGFNTGTLAVLELSTKASRIENPDGTVDYAPYPSPKDPLDVLRITDAMPSLNETVPRGRVRPVPSTDPSCKASVRPTLCELQSLADLGIEPPHAWGAYAVTEPRTEMLLAGNVDVGPPPLIPNPLTGGAHRYEPLALADPGNGSPGDIQVFI
jgi:hypothetical protein